MITDRHQQRVDTIAHAAHARCVLCGSDNPFSLNMAFHSCADGSVEGFFKDNGFCEGYPDMMHGGIIALLLDGAMTHCLFVRGRTGVTARTESIFRHPVRTGERVTVQARIEREHHPVYYLKAQLSQGGQVKATANGVFMDRSELGSMETVS